MRIREICAFILLMVFLVNLASAQTDLQKLREKAEENQAQVQEQTVSEAELRGITQPEEGMSSTQYFIILLFGCAAVAGIYYMFERRKHKGLSEKEKHANKERAELAEQYGVAEELEPVIKRLRKQKLSDKDVMVVLTQQGWRKEVVRDVITHMDANDAPLPHIKRT